MVKRYNQILVPLDGSLLAEQALDEACRLADLNQAKVVLLNVVSPISEVIAAGTDHPIFIDQQWMAQRAEALNYLHRVSQRIVCQNIEAECAVEMGHAAETIVDYANRHSIDMIVMATHGRTGLKRLVYGSVAEAVLHRADVPILLVRAHPESMPVHEELGV
jgi:nucleotide-binding universal stress UspA family protein